MADYKKMYAILCGAIDDVINPLEEIPLAMECVEKLKAALLEAEEIFITTTPYIDETDEVVKIKIDTVWEDFVENYAPPEDRETLQEITVRRKSKGIHVKGSNSCE